MRILVLNWWDRTSPWAGGAEVHLHQIFGRIARCDHQVTLLCAGYSGSAGSDCLDGITVLRRGSAWNLNLLAPAWVRARVDQFDVVVDYTNKLAFLTPLYVRLPRLCVAHHVNGETFRHQYGRTLGTPLMWLERLLFRVVYRRESFAAVSPSTAHELAHLGVSPGRVRVIYNGADHLNVTPVPEVQRQPIPLLLYVGRLKRYKDLDTLLRALQSLVGQVPEVASVFIGGGDDRARLEKLAADLGIGQNVSFLGPLSEVELIRWLTAAWVVANPSRKEGWGLCVMEAARFGVPAVGADVPGLRDAIVHGETGLLVPPGRPNELCQALGLLLTDEILRATLGRNAQNRAAEFTWAQAAEQMLTLLEKLISAGGGV